MRPASAARCSPPISLPGTSPAAGRPSRRWPSRPVPLLSSRSRSRSGRAGPETGGGGPAAELARRRAEIDQATGMLTEQLGVGIEEAFVRLRAYAYARERRLIEVAGDIVARRLRLGPGRDLRGGEQ